jgi:hypothetical protein
MILFGMITFFVASWGWVFFEMARAVGKEDEKAN